MSADDVSMVAGARKVAEVAAPLAGVMEDDRRLHPDVVRTMTDAGFMRHFVPRGFGGSAGTFGGLLSAVSLIGETCTASAWCAALAANTARFVSFLPVEGQAEVWSEGPDAHVVASVVPLGAAVATAGGWTVSGRWPYLSGIEHADWAVVCAMAAEGPAAATAATAVTAPADPSAPAAPTGPEPVLVAVPRSGFRVENTWNSVGLRATGSHTVVVDEVFVPLERSVPRRALFAGRPEDPLLCPGAPRLVPLPAVNGLVFVAPALGAVRGALALFTEQVAAKRSGVPATVGTVAARTAHDVVLARSAAETDAVRLLLERVATVADGGAALSEESVRRSTRDSAYAIDALVRVVNRLYRASGTSGQRAGAPLERFWRDVNSVATHQALQFEPAAQEYTSTLVAGAGGTGTGQ
ncbi:hydrolase [Nocardiopsis aegyptia]|uniref:hydrolase n=1 Tax=Nocardiopsis aegyptia TaxID=220378 RepID=UPI003671CB3C